MRVKYGSDAESSPNSGSDISSSDSEDTEEDEDGEEDESAHKGGSARHGMAWHGERIRGAARRVDVDDQSRFWVLWRHSNVQLCPAPGRRCARCALRIVDADADAGCG